MILGIVVICAISVVSAWLVQVLGIPIPGAIVGLLLLTGLCVMRGKPGAALDRASQLFTLLIPLLIMPSCIGIMEHWTLLKKEWLAIVIAIAVSVVFTLITTPWLYARIRVCDETEEPRG